MSAFWQYVLFAVSCWFFALIVYALFIREDEMPRCTCHAGKTCAWCLGLVKE